MGSDCQLNHCPTYTICLLPGCASIQFFWDTGITSSLGANLAHVNTMVNEVHHRATSEKVFCHLAVISEREKESTHMAQGSSWELNLWNTSWTLLPLLYSWVSSILLYSIWLIFCPPNLSSKAFNDSEMGRSNTPNSGYSACPHDV